MQHPAHTLVTAITRIVWIRFVRSCGSGYNGLVLLNELDRFLFEFNLFLVNSFLAEGHREGSEITLGVVQQ